MLGQYLCSLVLFCLIVHSFIGPKGASVIKLQEDLAICVFNDFVGKRLIGELTLNRPQSDKTAQPTAEDGSAQPQPFTAGLNVPTMGLVHTPNTKFMNFVGVRDHVATGVRTLLDIAHTERVCVY